MTSIHNLPTADALIEQQAPFIEGIIDRDAPKSEFRVGNVFTVQRNRTEMLADNPNALHSNWDSLDSGRRSAACRFEWARLVLFLIVILLSRLKAARGKAFHVIIADKRWQVSGDDLGPQVFDCPRRKLRRGVELLRKAGVKPVFVAVYELSAARNLDGTYLFEPHIHLLIVGATNAELKAAFRVRQHRSERGKAKPVRIVRVRKSRMGRILGYLSKIKAQERVEYEGEDGKRNRSTNRMSDDKFPLWLGCMAQIPITKLVQFGGFQGRIPHHFAHLEMAALIGEL